MTAEKQQSLAPQAGGEPPAKDLRPGPDALQAIIQAAESNANVDTIERLMALYERQEARRAEMEFAADLAAVQAQVPSIDSHGKILNKQGGVQSRYQRMEDIHRAVSPLLERYGFSFTFDETGAQGESRTMTATLRHRGGHKETMSMTLPLDKSGSKNATQSAGSTARYGMRYLTIMFLNIQHSGEDTGGIDPSEPKITGEQLADLQSLIEETNVPKDRFLEWVQARFPGVENFSDLPASGYVRVVAALEDRRKGKK